MKPMHTLYLKVGTVVYEVVSEAALLPQPDCAEFFTTHRPTVDDGEVFVHCRLDIVEVSSRIEGKVVFQDARRIVLGGGGLERRLILDAEGVAAYYRETAECSVVIEICQPDKTAIRIDTYFLEAFALDRFLLRAHTLVLHSAFIEWQGKGILFTAPSGTGKSTQASLWNRYEEAEIINGDRALLRIDKEGIEACGLPFCGSSGIHRNKCMPLGAVVFIEQSPVNVVEAMPLPQAASRLFGEVSVNKWNVEAVMQSLDLIETLAGQIPMVRLKCNMEQEAVLVLKDYLKGRW